MPVYHCVYMSTRVHHVCVVCICKCVHVCVENVCVFLNVCVYLCLYCVCVYVCVCVCKSKPTVTDRKTGLERSVHVKQLLLRDLPAFVETNPRLIWSRTRIKALLSPD